MDSCPNILAITSIYIAVLKMEDTKTKLTAILQMTLTDTKRDFQKVQKELEAVSLHFELLRSQIIILEKTIKKAKEHGKESNI